jgi:scyllo-inosamine-4-phosphate amidinotransferase 1
MKVFIKNEYAELKSVIVGRPEYAVWPKGDNFFDTTLSVSTFKGRPDKGPLPEKIIQEAREDAFQLIDILADEGVKVFRPEIVDWRRTVASLNHITTGMHSWSARDILLSVGNMVIECPTPFISRQHETIAYHEIRKQAIADGCRWIAAPIPPMEKKEYNVRAGGIIELTERYPIFDAANVVKMDDKLLYLKSCTGNLAGAKWLQNIVGSEFEVIVWDKIYQSSHIDSTLLPIGKDTVLLNVDRVTGDNLPKFIKSFKKIWVHDCIPNNFYKFPYASKWIGMNVLAVNPETIIVDTLQKDLIKQLKNENYRVLDIRNRHSRTLGGGFHCMTCDLERE